MPQLEAAQGGGGHKWKQPRDQEGYSSCSRRSIKSLCSAFCLRAGPFEYRMHDACNAPVAWPWERIPTMLGGATITAE